MKRTVSIFLTILTLGVLAMPVCGAGPSAAGSGDGAGAEFMTFAEMVERYVRTAGVSSAEALEAFPASAARGSADAAVLSVALDASAEAAVYKPRLEFYCAVSKDSGRTGIKEIYHVELNRVYPSRSTGFAICRQFNGVYKVWFRDAGTIEYSINGDFYRDGAQTVTAPLGGGCKVGEDGAVMLSVAGSGEPVYFSPIYQHGTVTFFT